MLSFIFITLQVKTTIVRLFILIVSVCCLSISTLAASVFVNLKYHLVLILIIVFPSVIVNKYFATLSVSIKRRFLSKISHTPSRGRLSISTKISTVQISQNTLKNNKLTQKCRKHREVLKNSRMQTRVNNMELKSHFIHKHLGKKSR